MKAPFRVAMAAILLAGATSAAQASGWVALLKNTPAEAFDEEDLQLFLTTASKALAEDGGEPVEWSNPATGSGGSFKPLGAAPSVQGLPCKRLRMSVHARKYTAKSSTLTACRTSDNKWKIAGIK
jgi:hypothetical protein